MRNWFKDEQNGRDMVCGFIIFMACLSVLAHVSPVMWIVILAVYMWLPDELL